MEGSTGTPVGSRNAVAPENGGTGTPHVGLENGCASNGEVRPLVRLKGVSCGLLRLLCMPAP